jgi:hypothetical protein
MFGNTIDFTGGNKVKSEHRWTMLCMLVLGIGGTAMMVACGSSEPGPPGSCTAPPATTGDAPTTCPAPVEEPCLRYHIPLDGNPSMDVALRSKYIAAFGSACYMSEGGTFDCFYEKWQDACADAVKIAEVSGNAPFDKGYTCQPVGNGDYTLQIGSDVANYITINYQPAPRQSPLVEVDGVPTEVNGPYRNLMEPPTLGTGQPFNKCDSGMPGPDGGTLTQREWILQVNRNANGGKIRSDLAGFKWLCKRKDENCKVVEEECEEPPFLDEPDIKAAYLDPQAQVHHVVPMKDKRHCAWGTNSNKNAAVISTKLNKYFTNNNPPEEEVKKLNAATAYTP